MKVKQLLIDKNNHQKIIVNNDNLDPKSVQLVLAFAQRTLLEESKPYSKLRERYPNADIVICSSSGQISDRCNVESEIVSTAISFEKTKIKAIELDIISNNKLDTIGIQFKKELITPDLKSILILSEGSYVNGTELINELIKHEGK